MPRAHLVTHARSFALRWGSVLSFLLPLLSVESARAFPQYPELLPNRAFTFSTNIGDVRPCITCHNNPDGGQGCVCPGGHGCDVDPTNTALHGAPCFNPFGLAFKNNGKVWNATLALADADGDGFTNGQELQDPLGQWIHLTSPPEPGNKAYVTRPGFPDSHPGLTDGDHDGVCWFGRDLNADGDCSDPNENTGDRDCDDADATTNSFAIELCTDIKDNNCDGLATVADPLCGDVVDNDGDGYCETGRDLNGDRNCLSPGEPGNKVDCDDQRSNVYFDAPENCVDGLDNDCDQLVDQDDPECDPNDEDNDGYCPLGEDKNGNGNCADPGEQTSVSDCDDANAAISPAASEVCTDAADNDCDGHPDFADSACFHLVDADGDGYCPQGQDLNGDGNCAGNGENNGKFDCNDALPTRNSGATEVCFALTLDADCDGLAGLSDPDCVIYKDLDGDGFCLAGQDLNQDGDCVDDDLVVAVIEYALTNRFDCDDTSEIAFPRNADAEALTGTGCFDGVDTDCDDRIDAEDNDCSPYSDNDDDGFCPLGTDLSDPKDGDCTDPGEAGEVAQDCRDDDPTFGPGLQENCVDTEDNNCNGLIDKDDPQCVATQDLDADGFCPRGTDLDGDGSCQGHGENRGNDCNDQDPSVNSGASEDSVKLCKDGKDNDCDGKADQKAAPCAVYIDNDQDGFCEYGRDSNFNHTCLDSGEQTSASDCDDTTKAVFPGRREICDDNLDNDCNGKVDSLDSAVCTCSEDAQCATGDPCMRGFCKQMRCAAELVCNDAGPPMEEEPDIVDAGVQAPPDAGSPPAPAPRPSTCSADSRAGRPGLALLAISSIGLIAIMRRRRSRR